MFHYKDIIISLDNSQFGDPICVQHINFIIPLVSCDFLSYKEQFWYMNGKYFLFHTFHCSNGIKVL